MRGVYSAGRSEISAIWLRRPQQLAGNELRLATSARKHVAIFFPMSVITISIMANKIHFLQISFPRKRLRGVINKRERQRSYATC